MAQKKLWAVKVTSKASSDGGYLRGNRQVVAVYTSEADAITETKWLNEIHKKSAAKIVYSAVRWKDDGNPTEIQLVIEDDSSIYTKFEGKQKKTNVNDHKKFNDEAQMEPDDMTNDLTSLFEGTSTEA